MSRLSVRARLRWFALAPAVALVFGLSRPSCAGWDDFEFGEKLIQRGYIEYARAVFEGILKDEKRPQQERDRARYGMALLGKADATNAVGNPKTPWKDAVAKLDGAIGSIDEFVKKFPDDPAADRARFESANLRQWFVEQSSRVADDKQELAARGADAAEVLATAGRQADAAIETYTWLIEKAKSKGDRDLAKYGVAVMGYFKALTSPKCSSAQMDALGRSKKQLDDYAYDNDGFLLGVYAQDYQGLAAQASADCFEGKEKWAEYGKAMAQFIACSSTDDQGDEYRKIIAQGYFHIGRLANHVAKTDELGPTDSPTVGEKEVRDLLKEARRHLAEIEKKAATSRLDKIDAGLRAMIEWGLVEWRLDAGAEAVRVLKKASDLANENGMLGVVGAANAALARVATGSGSGGDPSVLFKIGDDQRTRGKLPEAIAAFQKTIASCTPTPDELRRFVYPSWAAIGQSYVAMKLLVEAAAAYDALVDEVRAGRIASDRSDANTLKLANEALDRRKTLLAEIYKITDDPSDKTRRDDFTTYYIDAKKRIAAGGADGGVGDVAYRRARELFSDALAAKEKDEKRTARDTWATPLGQARPLFAETAKNATNDFQDAAYLYLVRVEVELEAWDDAVKAAAAARTWWSSDAGKKRAAESAEIAKGRRVQAAACDFWEARAHRGAKRDDEALKILDGFTQRHGKDAAGEFAGRSLGLVCEILADQKKFDEAEAKFAELLREAPDYYQIPTIQLKLALHHQDDAKVIQAEIDAANVALLGTPEDRTKGVKGQQRATERDERNQILRLTDLNQAIARLEAWFEHIKQPDVTFGAEEKTRKEKELAESMKQREELRKTLAETRAKIADLAKQAEELTARRAALTQKQVPSYRRMAELFRQLDETFQRVDAANPKAKPKRTSDGVGRVAYQFYRLAKTDPASKTDWATARDLFETYFGFADVQALPETNPNKRTYGRCAGEVWYRIAEAATAPEDAKKAYQKALVYLEPSAARNPVNVKVVRSVLRGELAVVKFQDLKGVDWRIPVRKADTVEQFRLDLKDLGGDLLPRYANEATQSEFEKAVAQFKRDMAARADADLVTLVKSLRLGGFDPNFYASHGVADNDFLLGLARAYSRSGVATDARGAVGAARAVLEVEPKAPEDAPEWWEAKTILLETYVGMAEREAEAAKNAADPKANEAKTDAKQHLLFATSLITGTKALYPKIGGSEAGEKTLAEWKELQQRAAAVSTTVGVPMKVLDLEKLEAPAAPAGMDGN